MDKDIKEWERRMFSADVVSGFLCELSRAIDYSYTRMLRAENGDFEKASAMVRENADWLKNILPRYIDSEAERLISLRNSDKQHIS